MTNQTRLTSTDELESIFQRELATDRWAATETAYALAVRHRDLGDWPASQEWAQQCRRPQRACSPSSAGCSHSQQSPPRDKATSQP
ncbi:hypothetical protein B1H20_18125 [Streptomyces violaceoruber]|uniref:Uncharacterized protein n=1 Tax=Streptomyces violaceoruber TaxID=1935 RepID=A0A1V0UCZ9_STRVN|nr:hypothetical protein B1H20_18125 [Streptomyces violaceoruber]